VKSRERGARNRRFTFRLRQWRAARRSDCWFPSRRHGAGARNDCSSSSEAQVHGSSPLGVGTSASVEKEQSRAGRLLLVQGERGRAARTRARCGTNAGVSGAAERRRIGTASATDTSRRGVYSAVRRLFALMARDTRRESGATGARTRPMLAVVRAHVREGAFSDVSGLSRMAPRHRDTPPNGSHGTPLGLAAAKPLLSASSVYAFSDHSPIVATFED
jgi:hypothetical protein